LSNIQSPSIGSASGWYTSAYFAGEEKKKEIAEAVEAARVKAIGEGREKALDDFMATAPDRLIEMFPEVFKQARKDAREAGFAEGQQKNVDFQSKQIRREGYDEGYDNGYGDGYAAGDRDARNRQIDIDSRLEAAEKDWSGYEQLIHELGDAARQLEEEPDNQDLIESFTALAMAAEQAANQLETAHNEQAKSFNSLMEDLRRAVGVRNIPKMRETSRAIQNTLRIKREQFLFGKKRALETFGNLEMQ
jgi:flagellar biosynthesis/type III secretory pathway protein FliH